MKADILLRDPVFQLNLLVWMAKAQPAEGYRVRPLFHTLDYQIIYVEQPFPLPEAVVRRCQEKRIDASFRPEPELTLRRTHDGTALYFEAKANSFSPDSKKPAHQARGHLLAAGPVFAEVFPGLRALLCYLVPTQGRDAMRACLATLAAELTAAALIPAPISAHGLERAGTDLLYVWDDAFAAHTGVSGKSAAVLHDLTEDTDPSPLFLIYTDEDYPDDGRRNFARRAFLKQVWAMLLCGLRQHEPIAPYQTTIEILLNDVTGRVYPFLGSVRRSRLRRLVNERLFRRITQFWADRGGDTIDVSVNRDTFTITWRDELAKEQFLEWFEEPERLGLSDDPLPAEEDLLPGFDLASSNPPAADSETPNV